jgi:photosystem II stability/assembly factor-like uncharacterized protein
MRSRTLCLLTLLASALAGRAEIYVSTDSGETWKARGPQGYEITQLLADPKSASVAWAIATPTVAKDGEDLRFVSPVVLWTGDGGENWETVRSYKGPDPICIAVDPLDTEVVYVGATFGRVMKSADGCKTWTLITIKDACRKLDGTRAEPQHNVCALSVHGNRVLAEGNVALGRGFVALSEDAGKSWTLIGGDFPGTCILDGKRILAANGRGSAGSSMDNGRTWTNFREGRG